MPRSIVDSMIRCPECQQLVRRRRTRIPRPAPHEAPGDGEPGTRPLCLARLPRRKKGWSVKDVDHIPIGERVMITANLDEHFKSWRRAAKVLGIPKEHTEGWRPYGVVTKRWHGTGNYFVAMEGGGGTIVYTDKGRHVQGMRSTFERDELLWPIPADVVPFDPAAVRARRARRAAAGIR
jgi:hypothetical protein